MSIFLTDLSVRDIRFPTSEHLDCADSIAVDPDYSCPYVTITTSSDGLEGHGITFTLGRGNEICIAAIESLKHLVIGRTLESITSDMAGFWRGLCSDSQLRWLGPEKGAMHLGVAAIVNAVWDLYAKQRGKPLWKLLADMSPQEVVDCIDFRYIENVLSGDEALAILQQHESTKADRESELHDQGMPAYTSSAGWYGYDGQKLRKLCQHYLAAGWTAFKLTIGTDLEENVRRATIMREEIGEDCRFMVDAAQAWGVNEAIAHMKALAPFNPLWIEEPTSPDDILGHAEVARAVAPIGVATGEHIHNRIMFKQFMQAGAMQFCQIDSCRVGGVNELLAIMLLAAKFNIPVCPHAGGVGLGNYIQHLSAFNYIAVAPTFDNTMLEYSDHLHEHFVDQVRIKDARYCLPTMPGYSITMKPTSLDDHEFPNGLQWKSRV